MSESFADHFSPVASTYALFRPTYPPDLFRWIATTAPARHVAWDCAAGSGQATLALAEWFDQVVATDASAALLAEAAPHPRVTWREATAEASGLDAASVDALTIAQGLHWFDLERFWPEVRRVVRPGGLVAAWTYGTHEVGDAAVDAAVERFSEQVVGAFWPSERRHVDARYATLSFPFERVVAPSFTMRATWTLGQMVGYMRSWSATRRFVEVREHDPVIALEVELADVWGDGAREVRWPLTVLAGIV